jgi:hypothetical protein
MALTKARLSIIDIPTFSVKDFGAVGDGSTDDRVAIQAALDAAYNAGGGTVLFEAGKTYIVSYKWPELLYIQSNVVMDLNNSTLQRTDIVGSVNYQFITNKTRTGGIIVDENITIKNGTIIGTGNTVAVSDQGHAIMFALARNILIENIQTQNTNGDGIALHYAFEVTMRKVEIGDFGRNGISPTNGSFVYDDVRIAGTPITGANPGLAFDAENDGAADYAVHKIYYLESPDMTFLDRVSAAGGAFAHEVYFYGGKVGPGFNALKITSSNQTNASNFYIGPNVEITGSGTASPAILLNNVANVRIIGTSIEEGTGTGVSKGIEVTGEVNNLNIIGAHFDNSGIPINSASATSIDGWRIFSVFIGTLTLRNATNCYVDACSIPTINISGATSADNVIGPAVSFTALNYLDSATAANQDIAKTSLISLSQAARSNGSGTVTIGGTVDSTVGAAGAATALPANPLGYLVAYVGTAEVKIPYYNT